MRVLRGISLALAGVLVLLAGCVGWIVATSPGTAWLLETLAARVDGVAIGDVDGTLAGELRLSRVSVTDPLSPPLRVERAELSLGLVRLLGGVLHVRHARLEGLHLALVDDAPEQDEPQAPLTLTPAPPLEVVLDALVIVDSEVETADQEHLRIERAELAGRWTTQGIDIDRLELRSPRGDVHLQARLRGGPWPDEPLSIEAEGAITWHAGATTYAGRFEIDTTHRRVDARVALSAPFEAALEAGIQQASELPWQLTLRIPSFDPRTDLLPAGSIQQLGADLSAEGTAERARIRGELRVDQEVAQIELELSGTPRQLHIETLQVQQVSGRLRAHGTIELAPRLRWDVTARASSFDPGELLPLWPGNIDLALASTGELTEEGPRGRLQLERLEGSLAGRPLSGAGELTLTPDLVVAGELRLRSGPSWIEVGGDAVERLDAVVAFDVVDLGAWAPAAQGGLAGRFRVTGAWPRLRVAGTARSAGVAVADFRAGALELSVDATAPEHPSGTLQIDARGVAAAGRPLGDLHAIVSGDPGSHRLSLAARGAPLVAQTELRGSWSERGWSGVVTALSLSAGPELRLELRDRARLSWRETGEVRLSRSCLAGADTELCMELERAADGGIRASYALAKLPFDLVQALVPGVLPADLRGEVSGEGDVRRTADARWQGQLTLRSPIAQLRLPPNGTGELDERETILLYEDLRVGVELAGRGAVASLSATLMDGGKLEGRVATGALDRDTVPLDGRLVARVPTLAPIASFVPEVGVPSGRLVATVDIAGTLAEPRLGGSLEAQDVALEVPALGLRLERGQLRAEPTDAGGVAFRGSVHSGAGPVTVEGAWSSGEGLSAGIQGERFRAVDLPGVRMEATPDLELVQRPGGLQLTGEVRVPSARLDLRALPQATPQQVSPDVVVVDREAPAGPARDGSLPLEARVTVRLGDDVRLIGPGLEATLRGQLVVQEAPGRPTTASGEVVISGRYQAYGQDLTIERGQILYAGTPLDNPRLNLTAVRQVEDVTVGLRIRGTAQNPHVDVFSLPPMGQADALAYLVTGRPLEAVGVGVNGERTDALAAAARSLGTAAGASLAERIGQRLGIDELGIEKSEVIGGDAFMIGQYLSPRLYLGYGVGLFEPGDILTLRYRISDALSLRVVRGSDETRAGIELRFER